MAVVVPPSPVESRATVFEQWVVVLVLALCSASFLGPALLPGNAVMPFAPEVLEPMRTEALADGRVTLADLTVGNPSFGDKYNQSITWDRISGDRFRAGEFPDWTRDIAGGAAFPPQQGQPYMPWSWLLWLVPVPDVYGLWFLLHQVVFGWFAYRFLRRIGVQHLAGVLGAVAVGIGLWTQARVHHNVIVSAALPLFAMLSCVHEIAARRGGGRAAAWLALGTGVSWLGGLPQASLMVTYLAGAYGTLLALGRPRGERLRPLLWIGAGLGVGGMIALFQMGPTLLAAMDTARGSGTPELLAHKALGWDHLLNAIWPDLLSWPAEVWYPSQGAETIRPPWAALLLIDWTRLIGDPAAGLPPAGYGYTEAAFSIGIAGLVLGFAGVMHRVCRREARFFAVVLVVSLGLALAVEPLMSLSAVIPGARAGDLKRFVFPAAMALSVLAALGLDRALARRLAVPIVVAALIALASTVAWLLHQGTPDETMQQYAEWVTATSNVPGLQPQHFTALVNPGEAEANTHHLWTTFLRTACLGAAVAVLLSLRARRAAAIGLIVLTAWELPATGRGPVVAVASERVTRAPAILAPAIEATRDAVGARPRFQRFSHVRAGAPASTLLRPNLGAFFGLEDLAAYNPLPPARMEEFYLAIEPDEPGKQSVVFGGAGVDQLRSLASLQHPMFDVLGLRFVLTDGPIDLPGHEDRTPAGYPHRFRLYERTTVLPRATFVTRMAIVEDREERLARIGDAGRASADEVLLEDPGAPAVVARPHRATVEIVSHEDERVVVRVSNDVPGYLRLADPWDPGWRATVDGEAAALYVADHYLRAVHLPAGEHTVEFRYDGATVVWPFRLGVLGLLAAMAMFWAGRRKMTAS